tara:strand:+ start:466 stop:741 length:276 start_codon:yes stop_codon:yes gene_type:complete
MTDLALQNELTNVDAVEAVAIKGGFRVDAVMKSGERVVLKNKSTRKPAMVQMHSRDVNGNCPKGLGIFFTFAKTVDSFNKDSWLKSFQVSE